MLKNNSWTIFYSFHDTPIHLSFLQKSNPQANIIPIDISNNFSQHFAWRNSDNLVRDKIKEHINSIRSQNIAIAEYDVLIKESLPNLNIDAVYCKKIMRLDKNKNWHWFRENSRLGPLKSFALGIFPMGFFLLNIEHLKYWLDSKYDFLYKENIFCELRLGTILNHAGSSIKEYNYPNILTRSALKHQNLEESILVSRQDSKIFHPVKNTYEI
jgi:hypothetical protein